MGVVTAQPERTRLVLARRIVPCLDVAHGRVVKGIRFVQLRDAGDPAEQAARYAADGADEIVVLDIAATPDDRSTSLATIGEIAERVFVPLTVGGGVRAVDDVIALLRAGADKVSINTAAVRRPALLAEASRVVGCQAVVAAIDAVRTPTGQRVVVDGGRTMTERSVVEWAVEAVEHGAGEILLTALDADGTRDGYDIELTRAIVDTVPVPVIASGGAGGPADFLAAFLDGGADAALAASIFHFGHCSIPELKTYLVANGVPIRPSEGRQ